MSAIAKTLMLTTKCTAGCKDLKPNPQFIYLRISGDDIVAKMKEIFSKIFPDVPLIFDELGKS